MKTANNNLASFVPQRTTLKMSPTSLLSLDDCRICPRQCGVDRTRGSLGFCRTDAGLNISAIVPHHGEEPAISGDHGICNVFFSHCNLQCRYCQNHQISRNDQALADKQWSLEQATEAVLELFASGINRIGFVSPSHLVPQMIALIKEVRREGIRPVVVYNTNGYDRVETLRELEEWVDVYLPDYKYADPVLAQTLSGAGDYPEVAAKALAEMYRQKGNLLHLDENAMAERGLIVRHLVLPGHIDNSLQVLRFLADNLSPRLTLSLMSQYQPITAVNDLPPFNRTLLRSEYDMVVREMERLGFINGWIQDSSSAWYYNPDFERDTPFRI